MKGDDRGEQANSAAVEEERNERNEGADLQGTGTQRVMPKEEPEFVHAERAHALAPQPLVMETPEQAAPEESGVATAPFQLGDTTKEVVSSANAKLVAEEDSLHEEEDEEGFTHEGQAEFERDDPLEAGYDLDEGNLIQPARIDRHFPIKTKIKTAREFFNTELLYRFDILEDDERAQLKGTYRVELRGYQGGIWTVNLGDSLDVVNRKEDAEVVLSMYQRDFLHLVNGVLNPQLAMFGQKMRVNGDIRKAVRFQCLLAPQAE